MSATLREFSAGVSWSGQAIASSESFDPAACSKQQTCDVFTLKVDVTDKYRQLHPDFALSVRLSWDDSANDFDLYVSKDGRTLEDSSQGQTNSEELRVGRPANGIYHIFTKAVAVGPATPYSGQAKIIGASSNPAQRTVSYLKDPDGKYGPQMFQFAPEVQIDKGDRVDSRSGGRTSIAIDAFGNTYVAADGSNLSLGEPQFTLGKLYVQEYPRWAAAVGASRLYVASSSDERLVLLASNNGGRTFGREALIARLTDMGTTTGLGNLVTSGTGTLYNVFVGASRDEIYLAKCIEPCERFVTRRIFSGGSGVTLAHPYPVLALDRAGGLHVVFSDGNTVFLMSSADGGATWKEPAVVNNPRDPDAAAGDSPWVFAGDSGRLGILWLGPQGDTYYAFTPDAFSPAPTFSYVRIGDADVHANLPSAAADPLGEANIIFGRTRLLRQIAGERLIFGPLLSAAGFVRTETGLKRVAFSIRQDSSGNLTYLDEQRRISLRSTQFTSSKRADQKISVSGRGRLQDGTEVSFTLTAADPNTHDKDFTIAMSNGYFAAGVLQGQPSLEVNVHRAERRTD